MVAQTQFFLQSFSTIDRFEPSDIVAAATEKADTDVATEE